MHNALSKESILSRGVRQVEVPELARGGQPAYVNHLPISAGDMIQFQIEVAAAQEIEKAGGYPGHVERMIKTLSSSLCDADGNKMFTEEELKTAPVDHLVAIMQAITGGIKVGNPSSGAAENSSASPTESLPS